MIPAIPFGVMEHLTCVPMQIQKEMICMPAEIVLVVNEKPHTVRAGPI